MDDALLITADLTALAFGLRPELIYIVHFLCILFFLQTEGFGPLFFGMFMSLFEHSSQPGAPFILASVLSLWAFLHCFELPAEGDMYSYTMRLDAVKRGNEEGMGLLYNEHDIDDSSVGSSFG